MGISSHENFMQRAVDLAMENVTSGKGGPFGALIVRNDEILAEAVNRVTDLNDPTAHAEILAIREACRKVQKFSLEGCDIYASCEPCPMCLGAIYWAKIDRIFYAVTRADAEQAGFKDSQIYREIAKPAENQKIPIQKIHVEGATDALIAWKKAEQKVMY